MDAVDHRAVFDALQSALDSERRRRMKAEVDLRRYMLAAAEALELIDQGEFTRAARKLGPRASSGSSMTDFVTFNRFVITSDDDQWPRGKPRGYTARLVLFLVTTGSPRTPTDLARQVAVRKTTIGSVLDQLTELGLVLRETPPHASHRRRVIVLPTDEAKEIAWDRAA